MTLGGRRHPGLAHRRARSRLSTSRSPQGRGILPLGRPTHRIPQTLLGGRLAAQGAEGMAAEAVAVEAMAVEAMAVAAEARAGEEVIIPPSSR